MPANGTMAAMRVANEAPDAEGVRRHGPPGKTLGRYRIGERIGAGGTAEVYRAEVEGAEGFAKSLVVKCLRPALVDEPELVQGLAREAKLAQRLQHGNIVQVLDFGVEDGRPYVVMEHVDGCSLHELCADLRRRSERMGLSEALFVVEEVAAALRYAHGLVDEQGVPLRLVHRDVKPRNVLVSREGVVKLADFGIAKLADDHGDTLPGVIKGTPAWLAPEQALGRGVDARTDVFALGLLLRELVGEGREGGPAVDPRVDEALRQVWQRASADVPEDRFADVQALLAALQRGRAARENDAGPGELPTWVRRARQQAPVAKPVALDAALLGVSDRDVTLTSAGQESTPLVHDKPRMHRGRLALGAVIALGGVAVAVWASDRQASSGDAEPLASSRAPNDPPNEPERDRADASAEVPRSSAVAPHPDSVNPATSPILPSTGPSASNSTSSGPTARDTEPPPVRRREPPPAAEPGRLRVNVLPWAEVTVDGRSLGRVPIDEPLRPGPHVVRLSNPQIGERTFEIELAEGGVHTISKW